jgi:MscS family membrane protein
MENPFFVVVQRILAGLGAAALLSFSLIYVYNMQAMKIFMNKHRWGYSLLNGLKMPVQVLVWLGCVYYSVFIVANYYNLEMISNFLVHAKLLIWLAVITWSLLRCKSRMKEILLIDQQAGPFRSTIETVNKFASFLILLLFGLTSLQIVGVPIGSFLAVGAVGAAGIAWASTDVIKNFFGGFMVHITRPFAIGDWINSPEKDIEGVVEEIGWYQTRIRSFEMRPIYVPNGVFPSIVLQNPSRMANRQITADISLRYEDAGRIDPITHAIEKMLRSHPDIDQARTLMVHLVRFGPYSLDINVYCYTKTVKWAEWRAIQQGIFLKIAEIIDAQGAKFAIPAQSIQLNDTKDFSQFRVNMV